MLIGPTLTLKELEEHINVHLEVVRKKANDLDREIASLSQESQETNPFIYENGERVENENYKIVKENLQSNYKEYLELTESIDFMNEKLMELETIEDDSLGAVNKEKDKITLTLNDCVLLGIKVDG